MSEASPVTKNIARQPYAAIRNAAMGAPTAGPIFVPGHVDAHREAALLLVDVHPNPSETRRSDHRLTRAEQQPDVEQLRHRSGERRAWPK